MPVKKPKQSNLGRRLLIFVTLVVLVLLVLVLMTSSGVTLYHPKGLIAQEQFRLMMFSTGFMLAIAIPTLALLYFFAWKYRESNTKAKHDPNPNHGKFFAASFWVIPIIALFVLTSVVWPTTHRLDPHKSIASDTKPLTIQVVAMRWKWLFIYPEQNIATVNYVQIPVDTPIKFELTADEAPMNSFWIPHIGGQLYAMTGHSNQLNLMATSPGEYQGQAAEINGPGFADMKFMTRASSNQDFGIWVQDVKRSGAVLDVAEYKKLLAPSEKNPATLYSSAQANLYDTVLLKYGDSHNHAGAE